MNYYLKNAALVFSVFIITSCGGGGGGGGGTTPIQALAAVISSFVSGESSVKIDTSVDLTWHQIAYLKDIWKPTIRLFR